MHDEPLQKARTYLNIEFSLINFSLIRCMAGRRAIPQPDVWTRVIIDVAALWNWERCSGRIFRVSNSCLRQVHNSETLERKRRIVC